MMQQKWHILDSSLAKHREECLRNNVKLKLNCTSQWMISFGSSSTTNVFFVVQVQIRAIREVVQPLQIDALNKTKRKGNCWYRFHHPLFNHTPKTWFNFHVCLAYQEAKFQSLHCFYFFKEREVWKDLKFVIEIRSKHLNFVNWPLFLWRFFPFKHCFGLYLEFNFSSCTFKCLNLLSLVK